MSNTKRYYYTYYSYETNKGIDGLGYIGSRACPLGLSPEEDIKYFGTPKSKKNQPFKNNIHKAKIILEVFDTLEEAIEHEVYLHALWDVKNNEHFANQSNQTSKKFCCTDPWNKGIVLPYPVWNAGKTGLQSHTEEWKQSASKRNKGTKNYFYEGRIYAWFNTKTKESLECTTLELLNSRKELVSRAKLYEVTWCKTSKQKSYKGWIVTACILDHGNQQPSQE